MSFRIVRNDITKMNTEAIVNTASDQPVVGSGCDSAVYNAAGYDELLAYRMEKIGFVPEGDAFITPGFNLQAKYIIHAVSPFYLGGDDGEEEKLRSCYRKSLQLAKDNGIRSIAFPLIATGGFGYPKEEGMRIAVDEINSFLLKNDMEICLVVFDSKATALGERIYPDLEAYIDRNYVEEKREEEYGNVFLGAAGPKDSWADSCRAAGAKPEERSGRGKSRKVFGSFRASKCAAAAPAMEEACAASIMADTCDAEALVFDEEKESKLEERMRHLSDTFSQYLMYLIKEKDLKNVDVYKRAIIDKKVFSKIKNDPDYHPQKSTALQLCVGALLNLDEAKDLLARAGYALSPCDKTDIIFSYFIESEIYDMIELDIQLEEYGLPCIIT